MFIEISELPLNLEITMARSLLDQAFHLQIQ